MRYKIQHDFNQDKDCFIRNINNMFDYEMINWNYKHGKIEEFNLKICRKVIKTAKIKYPKSFQNPKIVNI